MKLNRSDVLLLGIAFHTSCTLKVESVQDDPVNQFWKSNTTITIESNQFQLNEEYWVHRYSVPETNMFYEDWTAIDGTVSTYEYTVDLTENSLTVDIYMNEEFESSGEGTFEGENWDWSSLEYGFLQPDGVSVVTVAQFSSDAILYERVGYGMGGGAEWTVDEVLSPLDESDWAETLPTE